MSDEARLPDPWPLIPHLPPESAVIVRRRDADAAADMAKSLALAARPFGITVLLSAAVPPPQLDADGVHIPEASLGNWRPRDFHRLRPALVTASAHGARAVLRARRLGVDAVLLSPVFATRSHEDTAALGMMRFAAICQATNLPVIALGGISAGRVRRVLRAGAAGVAGIGLFTPRTG